MARTTGPLFSVSATGSIAKSLLYNRNKARNYSAKHHQPNSYKSTPQLIRRSKWIEACYAWSTLTQAEKDQWTNLKKNDVLSGFSDFTSKYLISIDKTNSAQKLPDNTTFSEHTRQSTTGPETIKTWGAAIQDPYCYFCHNTTPARATKTNIYNPKDTITKSYNLPLQYFRYPYIFQNILYTITRTDPSYLVMISLVDLHIIRTILLPDTIEYAEDLIVTENYIYIIAQSGPSKLLRLSRSNFTTSTVYTMPVGYNQVLRIISDETYLWIVNQSIPGRILRMTISDPSWQVSWKCPVGIDNTFSLDDDGTNLWISRADNSSSFIKMPKTDPLLYTIHTTSGTNINTRAVKHANGRVYIAKDTTPLTIISFDPLTPTIQTEYTIPTITGRIRQLPITNYAIQIQTQDETKTLTKLWL